MQYFFLVMIAMICDQASKWAIVKKMDIYASIPIIEPLFYITSHRNRGAAFGILQDERLFFICITFIIMLFLIYYIFTFRKSNPIMVGALSLILGGALGNFIDRVRLGEVIDFLDFRFGTYHFPVFNVADSMIVIGVAILIFLSLFFPQMVSNEKNEGI